MRRNFDATAGPHANTDLSQTLSATAVSLLCAKIETTFLQTATGNSRSRITTTPANPSIQTAPPDWGDGGEVGGTGESGIGVS
jgi:hypothetical protein